MGEETTEDILNQQLDGDQGRTEMTAYAIARLAGKRPEDAARASKSFLDDARKTWGSTYMPTRREVFASVERTLLDELP